MILNAVVLTDIDGYQIYKSLFDPFEQIESTYIYHFIMFISSTIYENLKTPIKMWWKIAKYENCIFKITRDKFTANIITDDV